MPLHGEPFACSRETFQATPLLGETTPNQKQQAAHPFLTCARLCVALLTFRELAVKEGVRQLWQCLLC